VRIWTSEIRSTTLTASKTPVKKSIVNDSHAAVARPNPIVATPKSATEARSTRPPCFVTP
jgi:hypothetical protein